MIRAEDVALVLLAAGRSKRFGDVDKLTQPFLHEPLAFHVVTALEAVPFRARIAVISGTTLDFASRGYQVVENPDPDTTRGKSLQLAMDTVLMCEPLAMLVALADMPRVTATHIYRLLDYAEGPQTVLASSDGVIPRPPALLGAAHFDLLLGDGDRESLTSLVRRGHHVVTNADELIDIDTPAELKALRRRFGVDRD